MRWLVLALLLVGCDQICPAYVGGDLLPWKAYTAHPVIQGHFGTSHVDYGEWAWDFEMAVGTPIMATNDGIVRATRDGSTVGGCDPSFAHEANYVVVSHGYYESLYLHLSSVAVHAGDHVDRGQVIGYSGNTGWSCISHLHFQFQEPGPSYYNQSILRWFYDTGDPYDPEAGTLAVSLNGCQEYCPGD